MLAGKANKHVDDYGADPRVFYGGEDGYHGSVEDYLLAKISNYKSEKGEDRLEALRLAINKEGGRLDAGITLNHQLMGALLNMAKGDETARVVTRVLVPNTDKHYVRLTMTSKSEGCYVLFDNKKGFSIAKACREEVEIPASGTLDIISNNTAGTGLRGSINPLYSMEKDLAHMAAINSDGAFMYEVPLYSVGDVDTIIKRKLPTLTLVMLVRLKEGGKVMLAGISYKVRAEADVHALKYSTRFRPENDPVFDKSTIRRDVGARVVIDDSVYAKINDHVSKLTKVSLCACKNGEENCSCKPLGSDARLSWTISRGEEILYSKNPTERWEVAHAGEQLIALQVLRLAVQNRGDRTIDHALSDPRITLLLLKEAGRNRLIDALGELFGGLDRIPSVLALATHSAGLPHEGCYDVECGPSILDEILPGHSKCSGIDLGDTEGLIAHSLTCRVQLLSAPDCKVRPSLLGYAVLALCLPGEAVLHVKNVAKEFGMVGTTLKKIAAGALSIPGDILYHTSRLVESTTSDLCRFVIGCERTRLEPTAHPCMRLAFTPKYLVRDHGHRGLQAITCGGWQTMAVRIKCSESKKKRSHIVMYRIGDRGSKSCTAVVYVPGLHIGFSCAIGAAFDSIFGVHSHARIGYGKLKKDKRFFFKNFLKTVLGSLPHACVNPSAEVAFSVTPHYPKGSSSYKASCDQLPSAPGESETQWRSVIYGSEPFKGEGFPFYPVVPVVHKLVDAAEGAVDLARNVLSAVLPIRVHSRDGRVFVTDSGLGRTLEMRFDPNIRHNVGLACATKHSLTKGAFRVMSHEYDGEFGSVLSLHPFTEGGKNVICVSYRGCTYVSEAYIKGLSEKIAANKAERIRSSINESKNKTALAMRPWLAVDKQAQKQEPIEVSFGGALAAGALGGLAAGAIAGPAFYGPRRYYYGPRYYPGPYYPAPYPAPAYY